MTVRIFLEVLRIVLSEQFHCEITTSVYIYLLLEQNNNNLIWIYYMKQHKISWIRINISEKLEVIFRVSFSNVFFVSALLKVENFISFKLEVCVKM